MIDGKREARKKWDNNTTLPLCALAVCANDAMNDRVANFVLNNCIVNSCPIIQGQAPRLIRVGNAAYDVMKN
jgi:hypothetical protein